MPKIAFMRILQQKNSSQMSPLTGTEDDNDHLLELDAIHEYMKDTGFSVYSDPKFLYLIGKICARS